MQRSLRGKGRQAIQKQTQVSGNPAARALTATKRKKTMPSNDKGKKTTVHGISKAERRREL